jgi:hypothetical protein
VARLRSETQAERQDEVLPLISAQIGRRATTPVGDGRGRAGRRGVGHRVLLHSNVRDGVAQRSVRDLQQARERTVEFQDQEDRP